MSAGIFASALELAHTVIYFARINKSLSLLVSQIGGDCDFFSVKVQLYALPVPGNFGPETADSALYLAT